MAWAELAVRVALKWITPDAERLIAEIARVSSSDPGNPEYERLLRYLIRNKHWSPFEMVSACFEIETSRAIAAQMLRHRSFSFQELSQRYAAVDSFEPITPRAVLVGGNRQSSQPFTDPLMERDLEKLMAASMTRSFNDYHHFLSLGVATESARFVLPLGTTTRLYMTGTLRSWIHYLALRCDDHAQLEHREVAFLIRHELTTLFPTVAGALDWPTPGAEAVK